MAALAADATYLAAWWLAPAAEWAPWLLAAGLIVGGARILQRLSAADAGGTGPWWSFCLPLVLPVSAWVPAPASSPPERAPAADGARRIGVVLALAALFTVCVTGLAEERIVDPLLAPVDGHAETYVDRALLQAGGTYVGARAFERLLAVAGAISIGIGFIEGRPGQIFEPLRDLLDRFSTVVLVALASLTLQKVMLQLGADLALALFGSAAIALYALAVAGGRWRRGRHALASAAGLLLGTAVVLRILLPLTGVGVAAIAARALADRQQAATTTVERAAQRVGLELELDGPGASPPPSADGQTIGARMGELKARAQALQAVDEAWLDDLFGAFVDLVAVFVIETLIAPLLVLLLLWRLWRRLAGGWQPRAAISAPLPRLPPRGREMP